MYVILADIADRCVSMRFNYALFRVVCQCFSSLGTHTQLLIQDSVVFVDIEPNVVAWSHMGYGAHRTVAPIASSLFLTV